MLNPVGAFAVCVITRSSASSHLTMTRCANPCHRETVTIPQIRDEGPLRFVRVRHARHASCGARARRVHLSPKSFDLLQILIERRPALVTKTELQDRLWPDSVVLEANLGNAVAEIRKALGDDPRSPASCGRFRGAATGSRRTSTWSAAPEPPRDPRRGLRWWLVWKDTILPLSEGDNVVGRSPDSSIWIDAASVSREHARIVIAEGRATVEDRGSTNGTFVNGKRIATRHPLVDGTTVTFGSEETAFREWSDTARASDRARWRSALTLGAEERRSPRLRPAPDRPRAAATPAALRFAIVDEES